MRAVPGLIATLYVALPVAAQANLILNGSFEDSTVHPAGPFPGGSWVTLYAGSTTVDNWTVTRDSIDLKGGYWLAQDGGQSLDLGGVTGTAGAIAQSFATDPGQLYQVSFWLAGNPVSCGVRDMTLSAAGSSGSFQFDSCGHTYADMGWVSEDWLFTATSSTSTLEFSDVSSADLGYGSALDNVTVTAVPEPASAEILALGLVVLTIYSSTRRRLTRHWS